MKKLIRRYAFFLGLLGVNLILLVVKPDLGMRSFTLSWQNMLEMLSILPAIFVLLGLMDVWVKKETMIKIMGEKSKLVGILVAFFLGSAAAGPLFAAFPVAAMLMKKGGRFFNVMIFIGAWSTTKVPMFLFEFSSMGWQFALLRLALNIPVIVVIAFVMEKLLSKNEIAAIYQKAEAMGGD